VPVPGPTALIAALAVSGLPTDGFVFLGFLPRRPGDRRRLLAEVAAERRTLVAYEAPHRLVGALAAALDSLGDRRCCVARELTKRFEEVRRETIAAALAHFQAHEPRGEFTLVFEGATEPTPEPDDAAILEAVSARVAAGESARDAIDAVATELTVARRRVYRLWQTRDGAR
jgi:16S rRNA (cytidine1402-2'-O)-methyltransferase